MSFNLFGKGFEIETRLSVAEVREAIRQRQRNPLGGRPKALLIGGLILLWMPSVGAEAQPQLVCHVTSTTHGSRIRGLFGFGIIFGWVIAAAFAGFGVVSVARGDVEGMVALAFALVALILFSLGSGSGKPLLRYLQNTLDSRAGAFDPPDSTRALAADIRLEIGDTPCPPPLTPQTILDALVYLQEGGDTALFLFRSQSGSLQAMPNGDDFVLEQRVEGEAGYRRAFRPGGVPATSDRLSREEAFAALLAYAADSPLPETIEWRQVTPRRA